MSTDWQSEPKKVYISLGSNMAGPRQQVEDAMTALAGIRDSRLVESSSLYRTQPVSDIPQEDYINAIACLETSLKPAELLLELQAIEEAFYRKRDDRKDAPRTLDLDIILFGKIASSDSHLTLPHPRFHERLFVLLPLLEVAGDIYVPGYGSLGYLIEQAPVYGIERLG
jgi:2-amino-4-hydroxy-6-hydroxymethyldihydropteridine diphosphokinase